MALIDKLNNAMDNKNNEFYTRYDGMEFYIENTSIGDYLNNKIVYLPCDTENSNIYKYLTDNKDKLNIKEILRTEDDYYGHMDLYQKCDIVFTNPPFTGLLKWIKWLKQNNLKYILWIPQMSISFNYALCDTEYFILQDHSEIVYYKEGTFRREKGYNNFITPNGQKQVVVYLISNDAYFSDKEYYNKGCAFNKTIQQVKEYLYIIENSYYCCDHSKHIPNDYYEPLYIPVTAYIDRKKAFEYMGKDTVICRDGKPRFRILVKLKR